MSYTLLTFPGDYYSAHGDAIYVVYDDVRPADTTNYTNYRYICDVFINGSALRVATLRKVPQPGTNLGIFNIGDIIRNYVAAVFNPAANTLVCQETGSGEFFVSVVCKFSAEFYYHNNYATDPTDYPGHYFITGDARILFNHYNGRLIGNNTSLNACINKVASNRPQLNYINAGAAYSFLPYFPTSSTGVAIQVNAYAGTTLQGTYNGTITPFAANNLQILNAAPAAVNNAAATTLINAATTHYTMQVNGGTVYTFKLTCEAVYNNYTIHFLNQYGGFESRDFTKLSRKAVTITKTDFGKLPYTIAADGTVSYFNATTKVYNETRSTYASQYTEKMTLNTDIITDEEYTWLGDLVLSPLVYIEIGGYFIPVAVTATNYEYRKRINDKLTNLQLDVAFGDQFNAQYR